MLAMGKIVAGRATRVLKNSGWVGALIAGFLALAGAGEPSFAWNHETTHQKDLTGMALKVLKHEYDKKGIREYSPEIWDQFGEIIKYGARDEDLPVEPFGDRPHYGLSKAVPGVGEAIHLGLRFMTLDLRANNHYKHGVVPGVGLTCSAMSMGDKDVDALTWAKTNDKLDPTEEFKGGMQWWSREKGWSAKDLDDGKMSWDHAVKRYGYKPDSKALAYYTLGFVLHLLQDMAVPEHVHDDPHGGSSFSGFESYMEKNWEIIKPPDYQQLRPWRPNAKKGQEDQKQQGVFADLDEYFDRLGKIAYSAVRFKGHTGPDPYKIEKGSDLDKMFDVEPYVFSQQHGEESWEAVGWLLKNKNNGKPTIREMKYIPERNLVGHKAENEGEWWPTWRELENVGIPMADVPGYYYIELSDDYPSPLAGKRDLFPAAYLPTPLPGVEEECRGWRKDSLGGQHLYEILARNLAPYAVEFSAGLIQYFFEIVNHPPYVAGVEVTQGGRRRHWAYWGEAPEEGSGGKHFRDGAEREWIQINGFVPGTDKLDALHWGQAGIKIFFSEPVRDVKVRITGARIEKLAPTSDEEVWEGVFTIPEEGLEWEDMFISIEAKDLHRHYGGEGDQLDNYPNTPAYRVASYRGYEWIGYLPGADQNHSLTIHRPSRKKDVTIRSIKPIVPNMVELSFEKEKGGEMLASAPWPLRMKAGQSMNLEMEYVVLGPAGEMVEVSIEPSVVGWARYSEPTPPPLRLKPDRRNILIPKNETRQVQRVVFPFQIPYPTEGSLHDLRVELKVTGNEAKVIVIKDAFAVEGPGTDFSGTGDLFLSVRRPQQDVRKNEYMGNYYVDPVLVTLQPLSGQSAPPPFIFNPRSHAGGAHLIFSIPAIENIPLGRYRIQVTAEKSESYEGPISGSTLVTLFRWNPADRLKGSFRAEVTLGEHVGEKRPHFVEHSRPSGKVSAGPKEWRVHITLVDANRKRISGARVVTVEGSMEAKDQGRGEYLLGPIANVKDTTLKRIELEALITQRGESGPIVMREKESVLLEKDSDVFVTIELPFAVAPAFVAASGVKKRMQSWSVAPSPAPAVPSAPPMSKQRSTGSASSGGGLQKAGDGSGTKKQEGSGQSSASHKRRSRDECIRMICPMCGALVFSTTNDEVCTDCIGPNEASIRKCMEGN